jgi:hypothetical protein
MVHVRKAKGSRKPFGKKESGYALYMGNNRVSPHFANWYPTKAKATKRARILNADSHTSAHSSKRRRKRR